MRPYSLPVGAFAVLSGAAFLAGGGSAIAEGVSAPTHAEIVRGEPEFDASLIRRSAGRYRHVRLSDGTTLGSERWRYMSHADGTRTVVSQYEPETDGASILSVVHVDAEFRPLEAWEQAKIRGEFFGASLLTVRGRSAVAIQIRPDSETTRFLQVPDRLALSSGLAAGRGWSSPIGGAASGAKQSSMLIMRDSRLRVPPTFAAIPRSRQFEPLGRESIEVPAGRFDAVRIRVVDGESIWISPKDRILIRSVDSARGTEQVLVELEGALN